MKKLMSCILSAVLLTTVVSLPACQTSQPGVKSSYRSQWTNVNGNTVKATEAAKDVLQDLKLQKIEASSTALDGTVHGYTADNTKITVDVKKVTDNTSQVSVYVGAGDPELGKDIIARIQKELS